MCMELPTRITSTTHPYLIKLMYAYRPHSSTPSRQEMMEHKYELDGHCSLKGIVEQMGVDYHDELNKRR